MNRFNHKVAVTLTTIASMVSLPSYAKSDDLDALWNASITDLVKIEIATGTPKELSEIPAVVSVITAADIRKTGARSLAEAIEHIPSLHVMPSYNRLQNSYVIRGVHTSTTPQILILIDGVEISQLTNFAVPIAFHYPTNFIERIEVIRGPGSAVYGADAFSGVINVITKLNKKSTHVNVGGRAGSFDYSELWLNANIDFNNMDLGFSYTREQKGNDKNRTTQYGVLARERTTDNLQLNLSVGNLSLKNWYYRIHQQMGVGASLVGNDIDRDISRVWKTQLDWDVNYSKDTDISISGSFMSNKNDAYFQLFPPGTWPIGANGNLFRSPKTPVDFPSGIIGNPISTSERAKLNAVLIHTGIDKHRIRLDLGANHEKLTDIQEYKNFGPGVLDTANLPSDLVSRHIIKVSNSPHIYAPNYDRDLWYISAQDEWKFTDNWELTAGIRHDNYSDFGSTTNPRLALVWKTSDKLTSKLLHGRAFRAPKISELAFINNPATIGNPNIKPEEMETLELVFDYRYSKNLTATASIFSYRLSELISQDSNGVYQNFGEQEAEGIEFEGSWAINEKISLSGNLSYVDAELPQLDEKKSQTPSFMGFLNLDYNYSDSVKLSAQAYNIGKRRRQNIDDRAKVDDYTKVDFTLTWQLAPRLTSQLIVKNVLNSTIIEPSPHSGLFGAGLGFENDYPMESREVNIAVTTQF